MYGKVAITTALGFDTFVVMRHGVRERVGAAALPTQAIGATSAAAVAAGAVVGGGGEEEEEAGGAVAEGSPAAAAATEAGVAGKIADQGQGLGSPAGSGGKGTSGGTKDDSSSSNTGPQLGCYFCNDVVAPLNSTIDRTLDQQCTVARPGLASIAGALAAELMAALLQHPLKGRAPAPAVAAGNSSGSSGSGSDVAGALGGVPHMIRGQLSGFSQVCMQGQGFSQCTGCSEAVVKAYEEQGWGFVREVLEKPGVLEELTGLAELHRQMQLMVDDCDFEEEEDGGEEEGGRASEGGSDDGWAEL